MKLALYSLATLVCATALFVAVPVFAQTSAPMTDDHIERIKTNCRVALGTLGRIHANDAPLYINRNQTYFSISDKLMARLNSRLTLNRYDATDLVKTASDFNVALGEFRAAYKTYDDTMSDLVRMDCQRAPVSFYDMVATAREQREKVHESVVEMQALMNQYREEVEIFQAKHFVQTVSIQGRY